MQVLIAGLDQGLKAIANGILPFLTSASAVGVLSMAFIQTLKDMFPIRESFQREAVAKWLRDNCHGDGNAWKTAESDLVKLATDGDGKAFYGLPVEQLCGQINAALPVILDYPARHVELLKCISEGANPDDIRVILEAAQRPRRVVTPNEPLTTEERTNLSQLADARTRVGQHAQRSVDGLQISVGSRWQYRLKLASIVLSVALAIAALSLVSNGDFWQKVVGGFLAGILGGFLAPVSRDLIAALQQLRQ